MPSLGYKFYGREVRIVVRNIGYTGLKLRGNPGYKLVCKCGWMVHSRTSAPDQRQELRGCSYRGFTAIPEAFSDEDTRMPRILYFVAVS